MVDLIGEEPTTSRNRRTPLHFGSGVHGCEGRICTADLWVCDLTHLSMRVGLYLHPRVLAIQSLRLPHHSGGLVRWCLPSRSLNRPPFVSHIFSIAGSNTGA